MTSMDTAALIRRTGRNLLLLGAALAAGQLAITIPGRELIRQAVRGPMPVSTPQLAEGLSALGDGFVEVRGVAVEPSAVRPTNHRGSKQGDRYALLALEDRSVVLVVASKAPTTTTISGVARPLSPRSLEPLGDANARVMPVWIDARRDRRRAGITLLAFSVILGVGAVVAFVIGVGRWWRPHRVASARVPGSRERTRESPAIGDLGPQAFLDGRVLLDADRLAWRRAFQVRFSPLSDLLWAYPRMEHRKVMGVTVRTIPYAVLRFRHGTDWAVAGSQEGVADLLRGLERRLPGLPIGYSPQAEVAFEHVRTTRPSSTITADVPS